jgi:hypothetical protein
LTFDRRVSFSERGMGQAVKEFAVGEGMLAARQELKVSPDRVKQLGPGECFVIVGGCAQEVRVSQVVIPKQYGDAAPVQPMPARLAVEGINAEQRQAYRQAVGASALQGTSADQAMLAATDANILTIGNVPMPPLPALVPSAPSIATGQGERGATEREQTECDEPNDRMHSGDQA